MVGHGTIIFILNAKLLLHMRGPLWATGAWDNAAQLCEIQVTPPPTFYSHLGVLFTPVAFLFTPRQRLIHTDVSPWHFGKPSIAGACQSSLWPWGVKFMVMLMLFNSDQSQMLHKPEVMYGCRPICIVPQPSVVVFWYLFEMSMWRKHDRGYIPIPTTMREGISPTIITEM